MKNLTKSEAPLLPLLEHSEQVSKNPLHSPETLKLPAVLNHEYKTIYCGSCGYDHKIPVYCGNRFCPVCGKQRQLRIRDRIRWIANQVQLKEPYRINFLTLTISNMKSCVGMVKKLLKCFRRLRSRAAWKEHVRGGCFVIELKRGSVGWHCHLHMIIESRYWNLSDLLATWKRVSGGSIGYIKQIPVKAIWGYLSKYLAKSPSDQEDLDSVNLEMKGIRLFSPFGTWYGLNKTYPKRTYVCPKCGASTWMWEGAWDKLTDWYGGGS